MLSFLLFFLLGPLIPNVFIVMALRRSRRSRITQDELFDPEANFNTRSKRQSRSAFVPASVTVSRSLLDSPGEPRRSLRLTVKMPAGKLREVTGGRSGRRSVNVFQENPIVSGPRASRNKRKIVEVPTTDDEDIEDQEEDEVEDEDAPGDEDEDADADGDLDMDEISPQPTLRRAAKAAVSGRGKATKSVEAKEMEVEGQEEEEVEDEIISDTDSDAEGEPDDQDESAVPEVNVDDLDEEDEEDDLDEDMDSDALAIDSGKLTKRQRGNLGNDFLQLPMGKDASFQYVTVPLGTKANDWTEPQVKKHLTAEERAMRRAEMARRRKNLSEKRNEEEKVPERSNRGKPHVADLGRWIQSTGCSEDNHPNDVVAQRPLRVRNRLQQSQRRWSPRRQTLQWFAGSVVRTVVRLLCPKSGSARPLAGFLERLSRTGMGSWWRSSHDTSR